MPALARTIPQDPAEWNDRDLLRLVLRSDERAWAELIRRYRKLIYSCIAKVTRRHARDLGEADTEEIYADVMVALVRDDMRRLRLFDPRRGTKLSSWIGMISINCAYDYLRGAHRRPLLDRVDGVVDAEDEHERSPLDLLMEKERWSHLEEMLSEFSAKDRTFVSLYFAQGLEAEAVAGRMAISLKTVYSKKHKVREHLRRCLRGVTSESPIADLVSVAA